MRVVSNLLDGEAKYVHSETFELVVYDFDVDSPNGSDKGSWPHVVSEKFALVEYYFDGDSPNGSDQGT